MPVVLTVPVPLPYEQLTTPARHGACLIVPKAEAWPRLARETHERLSIGGPLIAKRPLSQWRREARQAFDCDPEQPLVVLGHQPAFIHPGVWAKHVMADRLARALDGVAANLVVDTDVSKASSLAVPVADGGTVSLCHIRFPNGSGPVPFEHIPLQSPAQITHLERELSVCLADRYEDSQIPVYLAGLRAAVSPKDWVDQAVAGRRAIDLRYGIQLSEHRVSHHWCTPLVIDMMHNAPKFAASYNRALALYRRAHHIRGHSRPMPDLSCGVSRCELPLWLERRGRRRMRVFVSGSRLRTLFADEEVVTQLPPDAASCPDTLRQVFAGLDGWELRPRAITLTLWARLFLADFFIHGIGGAKYDEITDGIIKAYYGIEPPAMGCVSATFQLDLGVGVGVGVDDLPDPDGIRRRIRDLQWNPQRHLKLGSQDVGLLGQRERAVRAAVELKRANSRNRHARKRAYLAIRDANRALLATQPEALAGLQSTLESAMAAEWMKQMVGSREYFFGLFGSRSLEQLISALSAGGGFGLQ